MAETHPPYAREFRVEAVRLVQESSRISWESLGGLSVCDSAGPAPRNRHWDSTTSAASSLTEMLSVARPAVRSRCWLPTPKESVASP